MVGNNGTGYANERIVIKREDTRTRLWVYDPTKREVIETPFPELKHVHSYHEAMMFLIETLPKNAYGNGKTYIKCYYDDKLIDKEEVVLKPYVTKTSHNVPYANVKYPERYALMTKQHRNQKKESLQQAYREVAGF